MFADDYLGQWQIECKEDLLRFEANTEALLALLKEFGLEVNAEKSALIVFLKGTAARHFLQSRISRRHGQKVWNLPSGKVPPLPVKDEHVYLGTIISYSRWREKTYEHRRQACPDKAVSAQQRGLLP